MVAGEAFALGYAGIAVLRSLPKGKRSKLQVAALESFDQSLLKVLNSTVKAVYREVDVLLLEI